MKYCHWIGEVDAIEICFPDRQFNGFFMYECGAGYRLERIHDRSVPLRRPPKFHFGMANNGWLVYSPSMRLFLESHAHGSIQFLPFRFQRPDGTGQIVDYCVGQILRSVDCLDRERTKVRTNWQPVNSWGDFDVPNGFENRPFRGRRLFRINGQRGILVIREDLKDAIEAAGFKGQRFDFLESSP